MRWNESRREGDRGKGGELKSEGGEEVNKRAKVGKKDRKVRLMRWNEGRREGVVINGNGYGKEG